MTLLNPMGDKDWGYQNYTFGQDSTGKYLTGTIAYNTKQGILNSGKTGKTYLNNDISAWGSDLMSAYTDSLSNDSTYTSPHTLTFDNPTMGATPQGAYSDPQPSLLAGGTNGLSGSQATSPSNIPPIQPTSGNSDNASPQVSTVPGTIRTTIADSPTQTPVNIPTPGSVANQMNPGLNPLAPNKLKKGLLAGQGLASTKGAGELTNQALVGRKSLLAG